MSTAAVFDVFDQSTDLRAFLERILKRGGQLRCAAVTLAEVCRGSARTKRVESVLARRLGGEQVRVIPTDERLAKLVGAILHDTGSGSERLADAHVVAMCTSTEQSYVLTSDPDDIVALLAAVPGVRIVTRNPASPLRANR